MVVYSMHLLAVNVKIQILFLCCRYVMAGEHLHREYLPTSMHPSFPLDMHDSLYEYLEQLFST